MILRVLLWEDCPRSCSGCCNKQWNLSTLPTATEEDYRNSTEVLLTGGEPLLRPHTLGSKIEEIRKLTDSPIYVYTALLKFPWSVFYVLLLADGITVTLHSQADVGRFVEFDGLLRMIKFDFTKKSLRLNVFKGVKVLASRFPGWKVKDEIEWIEDCPLPENEKFMRVHQSYAPGPSEEIS